MLARIISRLRPRRTLDQFAAELDRRAARLDALAGYITAVYRQAGLPVPQMATVRP